MDRIWFDGLTRNQGKANTLNKGGEQELTLHQSKVHPNDNAITQYRTKDSMDCHTFVKVIGMFD
jgi:hypothetical protein